MSKKYVIFLVLLLFCQHNDVQAEVMEKKEQWITVFIHGSYGTSLSILSFFKVLQDQVDDTVYHRVQKKMRQIPEFYADRFMSKKQGLTNISDLSDNNDQEVVNRCLIDAYRMIEQKTNARESNHYYLFGWSGLLSQRKRREAARELYQALRDEVKNSTTKIRIICHSHGGNVGLLLAAVNEEMHVIDDKFFIDELILYATPMQHETERFCFSNFFKKIYNFYSENDGVQAADFISTHTRKSRQRIDDSLVKSSTVQIKQIKMLTEQRLTEQRFDSNKSKIVFSEKANHFKERVISSLHGGKVTHDHPENPTHADFWCVEWKRNNCVSPLPLFVFTSLFLALLNQASCSVSNQEALTLKIYQKNKEEILFSLYLDHVDQDICTSVLAYQTIEQIKKELEKVKPSPALIRLFENMRLNKHSQ